MISNDGSVKTADLEEDWYNYSKKRWANMALVKSSARSKYLGMESIDVSSSDILAYFVWVPRFKYKIWTTAGIFNFGRNVGQSTNLSTTRPVLILK